MLTRRRFRSFAALSLLAAVGAAGAWACDDGSSGTTPTVDGGTGAFDAGGQTRDDGATGSTGDASATGDSGSVVVDPNLPVTCKSLHAASPAAPSGVFTIDLDGAGTAFAPMQAYCDMTFDGGGWTMIQSFTASDSPASLASGVDGGPGVVVGVPEPGKLGGFHGASVAALAQISTQVHIRLSFASDAGANGTTWVTSRAPQGGVPTRVMTNLKNLDVLTKDTDGGFEEWMGPQAIADKLAWVPMYGGGPGTCLNPVQATKYPSIYWACGNFTSMNLYAPQGISRWTYSPNGGNEPMEVLVR